MGHSSLGREGKTHDRRKLRGLNAKANPFEKRKDEVAALRVSQPPVALVAARTPLSILDCGASLLSRQLQRDQSRMFQRAYDAAVDGVIAFTSDFDRIGELVTLVRANPGRLYGAWGLGPDNIKKTFNEKWATDKMGELRTLALSPECVALWSGLDAVTRDVSSHFAQERILELHLKLGSELRLPLLLTEAGAAERMAEKLSEWREEWRAGVVARAAGGAGGEAAGGGGGTGEGEGEEDDGLDTSGRPYEPRAAIFGFEGDEKAAGAYLEAGAFLVLTGAVCDPGEVGERLRALVPTIPLSRLLLASNSPAGTPANIPDAFVRDMRNEPSNLPFLLPVIADAYSAANRAAPAVTPADVARAVLANSILFYGLQVEGEGGLEGVPEEGKEEEEEGKEGEEGKEEEEGKEGKEGEGHAGGAPAGVEEAAAPPLSSGVGLTVTGREYHCRTCRARVFTDRDVQVHDGTGLRPSLASVAAGRAGPAHDGVGQRAPPAAGGGGGGGKGKREEEGRKSGRGRGREAEEEEQEEEGDAGETAVGKWREAKGRLVKGLGAEGGCRMLLVDRQSWMAVPADEPEGSLICPGPGCGAKLGQYNLAGLKCSCGLHVTPAFKIPKGRVDMALQGVDALDVAAAIEIRLGGAGEEEGLGVDGDAEEGRRRERKKKAAVTHRKGNFSEFRNKNTAYGADKKGVGDKAT